MEAGERIIAELAPQVLANCQRSDAEVSGRFSLCGLLLRLRNLYKWEQGLPPWREESPELVLDWVAQREERWLELLGEPPQPLRLDGREYDPFDTEGVNALLEPQGLIYGAGLAGALTPVFFLGSLLDVERRDGLRVFRLGREMVSDILFLPGLRQEQSIYLRTAPLAYLLWDKLADPRPSQARFVALGLAGYGLERDELLKAPAWEALGPVLEGEARSVLWHELGEAAEGGRALDLLHRVLAEHQGSELEFFVRGVKDLLADCGEGGRLATIIKEEALGPLGFYPAWLAGFPRLLFPELAPAVLRFMEGRDWAVIEDARRAALARAELAVERVADILERTPAAQAPLKARREVIEPLTAGRCAPGRQD